MIYRLAAAYTVCTLALRKRVVDRLEDVAQSDPEAGDAVQTVIIIAALALIAIGVVTIIGKAVIAKAHSISLDTPGLDSNPS